MLFLLHSKLSFSLNTIILAMLVVLRGSFFYNKSETLLSSTLRNRAHFNHQIMTLHLLASLSVVATYLTSSKILKFRYWAEHGSPGSLEIHTKIQQDAHTDSANFISVVLYFHSCFYTRQKLHCNMKLWHDDKVKVCLMLLRTKLFIRHKLKRKEKQITTLQNHLALITEA